MTKVGLFIPAIILLSCYVIPTEGLCQVAEQKIVAKSPEIWVFNGTPGDDEHHKFYEDSLTRIRKILTERYGIDTEKLHIYYGPEEAGYAGIASREAVLESLKTVVEHSKAPDAAPVWLIFQGHANRIPGGALFNLPGPDISTREIGEALKDFREGAQLVVIATTGCSETFVKPLAGKGRIVMSAVAPGDKDNETEMPTAFVQTLEAPESDTDKDGILTMTEIFLSCFQRVVKIFDAGGYMITEHPQIDGDGDGKATQRPAPNDAAGAAMAGLVIKSKRVFE